MNVSESYETPQCAVNEDFRVFGILCTSGGSTNEPFQEDLFEM